MNIGNGHNIRAALACIFVLGVGVGHASDSIHVGPNLMVSGDVPDRQYLEVWIGSNPKNELQLVACGIEHAVSARDDHSHTVVYLSTDGGASWHRAFEAPGSDEASDPICEFTADGTLYFSTLRYHAGGRTEIYRSEHGGPLELQQTVRVLDRDSLTVDHWLDRNRPERVFLHGTTIINSLTNGNLFAVATYRRSPDGRIFEEPRIAGVASVAGEEITSNQGVVLEDGSLGTVELKWPVANESPSLVENRYSDPATMYWMEFKPEQTSAPVQSLEMARITPCPSFLDSGYPRLAIDTSNGPFRGRIYVTWGAEKYGRCRIFLSTSDDHGTTWSAPATIDGPAEFYVKEKSNSSMPAIAVNKRGIVGVSWYDRTNITNQVSRTTRFAASLDGGTTFLSGVAASSATADYSDFKTGAIAVYSLGERASSQLPLQTAEFGMSTALARGGETAGIITDSAGRFHLLWTDNRSGTSQMWTTTVEVDGTASQGAPALNGAWRDVTRDVVVEYLDAKYDAASKTISIQVRLSTNLAPFKATRALLRLTRTVSPFGEVEIQRDGTAAAGIYEFVFSSDPENGRYVSAKHEIRCSVEATPVGTRELTDLFTVNLLRLEARVYSPRK
jgi:hypothetical protein